MIIPDNVLQVFDVFPTEADDRVIDDTELLSAVTGTESIVWDFVVGDRALEAKLPEADALLLVLVLVL
jgi:hypothetical protein